MGTNIETSNSENSDGVDFTLESNKTTCKNCEQEHEVGFEFCPHCGQKTNEELTVGVLFYNTISNYFSFDARFFKSFIPLMFKPGILAKRFIEGKRLLYLHPAQMYLFISVVFFFLFSFIVRDQVSELDKKLEKGFSEETAVIDSLKTKVLDTVQMANMTKNLKENNFITDADVEELQDLDSIIKANAKDANKESSDFIFDYDDKKVDSLIAINAPVEEQLKAMGMKDDAGFIVRRFYSQVLKFQTNKKGGTILQTFYDSIPIALFILLPIFALILKLFFWKRGPFAYHLVFSFYFYSFVFTVLSIILLANFIWEIPDWIDLLVVLSTFFYLFLAIKHFYRQGYFVSFFKTGFITFMYMIFIVPLAISIMMLSAFLFY
jgi:Protein of unknown function (DUF3667)